MALFGLALLLIVLLVLGRNVLSLAINIRHARRSGLPYVVLPVYTHGLLWRIGFPIWMRVVNLAPRSWTHSFAPYLDLNWSWNAESIDGDKSALFERAGGNTFLLVSPSRLLIYCADATAVAQIVSRRNDFPKPIDLYRAINIYGSNVITSEGDEWRHHRKIASTLFTEKSNEIVFRESVHQAKSILLHWLRGDQGAISTPSVSSIASDTNSLSLNVISRAGFGVGLTWPHEDKDGMASRIPDGHKLSFSNAIESLMDFIYVVIVVPEWLRTRLPIKAVQRAQDAYVEWGKYMRELADKSVKQASDGDKQLDGMDLMGALVQNSVIGDGSGKQRSDKLSLQEVFGNAFVFILAGHETTANSFHFSFIFLAMHWSSQSHLQADVDRMMGDRAPDSWVYDKDIPKLLGCMAGAVMNETLRLVPSVLNIPKSVTKDRDQSLTLEDGRRVMMPANALVNLSAVAIHRSPRYWAATCPEGSSEAEMKRDLNTFRPERWLLQSNSSGGHDEDAESISQTEGEAIGTDTPASFFQPPPGSYIPFSSGARACIGRRFAQVEIVTVLATIFREYSVELAVDDFASDEEIERMPKGGNERKEVWLKAAKRARWLLKNAMESRITQQMTKGAVPLRFVKRGEERFHFDIPDTTT